jgi:arylsulfatase B
VHHQLDSTDFIFIGDNGNTMQTAQIANTNRAKGTIYQYGVHVPFIISGPSVVHPGRVSDALVNTADLFATILELFGYMNWAAQIPANKPVDSKSLLPVLKDQSAQTRPWAFTEIFKTTPDGDDGKTMRNMDYKLLRFDDGQEEFYHLSADPNEANNLLTGTLNATEQSNYIYLCTEMTNLVGSSVFCTPSVGTADIMETDLFSAYPNPFHAHIYLKPAVGKVYAELSDAIGQVVFAGKNIENQDFSGLANGVYFLKIYGAELQVIKLEKE